MTVYRMRDMVKHKDGRTGMVERVTGSKVSVQFEHHARTSVVDAKNISHIERPGAERADGDAE